MKKLLIACSMIGAVALVACATDNTVKPKYDEESWFGATVSNHQIVPDRGTFFPGTESTVGVSDDDKIEIDSELGDPVSFKLYDDTYSLTTQFARVTFELDPAVVPFSARPEAKDLDGVKVAFALSENAAGTATNFCVWTGSDWADLGFKTIPTDTYELTMNFDESDANARKVQFSKNVGNATEVSGWYDYTAGLGKPKIDFVGSGKITQLAAAQLKLVSADVDFNGQSVKIAGDDMGAMKKLITEDDATLEIALAKPVNQKVQGIVDACELSVAEAYAIGLIAKEGQVMKAKADGTFKVKADATAQVSDGIKIGFVTPLTPNDTTAKITYGLKGSKTGKDTDWEEFDDVEEKTVPTAIVIPTTKVTEGYRYFKVVTKVDLRTTK